VIAQGVDDRAVGLAEAQEFVTGLEPQRGDDCVQPLRRILDKDPVLGPAAEKPGDACSRAADQPRQRIAKKRGPVRFHLQPERLCRLQHHTRRRAEAAVVEMRDAVGEVKIGPADAAKLREIHRRGVRGSIPPAQSAG
jgi:hypothetical protein